MSITRCLTFPKLFVIVLLSGYANNIILCNQLVSRFEYKFSFKPPYLAQKDGSVPFWEYGGSMLTFLLYNIFSTVYYVYIKSIH